MKIENVRIALEDGEAVSGIVCVPKTTPDGKTRGLIVAHGAANDMNEPMIAAVCEDLAEKGLATTLRFNFSYREKGKKSPDSQKKLESTWKSACEFFRESLPHKFDTLIIAGKSMGGRVASQLIADNQMAADGLLLLGYPLHASGRKERLRDEHLYDIRVPTLFIEGTRDTLCDLDLLQGVLEKLRCPWDIFKIEGGDHSFRVPESIGIAQDEVFRRAARKCGDWLRNNF